MNSSKTKGIYETIFESSIFLLLGCGSALSQNTENLSFLAPKWSQNPNFTKYMGAYSIVFSKDSKTLAIGGIGGDTVFWDARSGEMKTSIFNNAGTVNKIVFSPNGDSILNVPVFSTGDTNFPFSTWDIKTGKAKNTFLGHEKAVLSADFSPDGKIIASGSNDKSVILWDTDTGKKIKTIVKSPGRIANLSFSPDGLNIATSAWDDRLRLWNIITGLEQHDFEGNILGNDDLTFSPDGKKIAASLTDGSINLWETKTGSKLLKFTGHTNRVLSLVFSSDGSTLITGSQDKTVRIWDVKTGKQLRSISLEVKISDVSISSDGKMLAISPYLQPVQVWSTANTESVFNRQSSIQNDGVLNLRGNNEGAIVSIDGEARGLLGASRTLELPPGTYRVVVTQDGFKPFNQIITIISGQTTQVNATLERIAASLRITSSTPNATLTIDGRAIGSLPSSGYTYQTSSNTAIVVITAPGFKTETRSVNLQAGQLTDLQLNLQPEPTLLIINSSTPNARASVDGVDRGLIPSGGLQLTIASSFVTVLITAPDYEPIRQNVTRNDSGVTRVMANLERSTGTISIRTTPRARIRINGGVFWEADGSGLFTGLAPVGLVTIVVQREGFKTFSQTLTVTRNQMLEVNATLESVSATLTIQSNTPNARVRIAGQEVSIIGSEFKIELTPGTKVIQVIAAGFETQTFSVSANAGEQIVREVNLTPRAAAPTPAPVTVAPPVSPQPVTTPPPAPVVNTGNAPSTSTKPRDDVYALVIGIDDYRNSGIPDLKTAVTDARRFAAALENPRIGNIAKGNIRVLLNEAATKVDLEGEFTDALGTLKPNQTLIVYFAGHGAPTPDGNSLLLPVDANPNASRLEISSIALPDWARRAAGKRVLFVLDSCFSGQTGTRSLTADATRPIAAQIVVPKTTGLVTILGATSSNQSSQENTTGGLFTNALLEGLGGKADANKDGVVTLEEAFAYTRIEVSGSTRSTQIPSLNGVGLNLFAFAQNSEVLALANVNSRLAKIDVLYKAGKLTVQQYNALSSMIEGMREARELKLFLDGDSSMPEDAFLRLLRRGNIAGAPSGTP